MADEAATASQAEVAQSGDAPEKSVGMKTIAIVVIGLVVIVAGTAAVTLYLTGGLPEAPMNAEGDEAEQSAAPKKGAIYHGLTPFTIGLDGDENRRFLQLTMVVMTREAEVVQAMSNHRPAIRSSLTNLLVGQTWEKLSTPEGRDQLRIEATATIREVLARNAEPSAVEDVYFTDLVSD